MSISLGPGDDEDNDCAGLSGQFEDSSSVSLSTAGHSDCSFFSSIGTLK